jgi:hypothetical protein
MRYHRLSGADVFWLAARSTAGSGDEQAVAAELETLRPAPQEGRTETLRRILVALKLTDVALNLTGAILFDARLQGANLINAQLQGLPVLPQSAAVAILVPW